MTDTASKAAVGSEWIREVLETEDGVRDLPSCAADHGVQGAISFENVSWRSERASSVAIEPRQAATLVGPTASKATIIDLLARSTISWLLADGITLHDPIAP